jgi:hypothetical protein
MDNKEIIDSIIMDCNAAIHEAISGNYVSWCNIMVQIVKKLSDLKDTMEV